MEPKEKDKACSKAMTMYVREELKKGKSKREMQLIICNAEKNMILCEPTHQTFDTSSNLLDYWHLPPGVLVLKKDFVFPSR